MTTESLHRSLRVPLILLVEDTASLRLTYSSILKVAGFHVECAETGAEALEKFNALRPIMAVMDLMLPDRDGLDLLQAFQRIAPETPMIVVTAHGSIDRAVEAMRAGAHEFLVKPVDQDRLLDAITQALRSVTSARTAASQTQRDALPPFIGSSVPMQETYRLIRSVARSMATAFITGESGTGKELCAEAVHRLSTRRDKPFIALNCGAIPGDLLESEVFGHLKGSFTGAISDKQGAAAAADGGTLFLDEVCEMDLNLQTKLLRFLQTSTITPVGATRPRKVDVRIVCATNRVPEDEVRNGRFREDLFYRLHVVPIHMPPLRARGDDVVQLAQTLLDSMADEEGSTLRQIDPAVLDLFRSLPWPGNVRQLINVLRNAVVLNEGSVLTLDMLPSRLRGPEVAINDAAPGGPASNGAETVDLAPNRAGLAPTDPFKGWTLARIERMAIETAIRRNAGSVPQAARELGVSPSTLYRKRQQWDDNA